jgi:hypothetical protein
MNAETNLAGIIGLLLVMVSYGCYAYDAHVLAVKQNHPKKTF